MTLMENYDLEVAQGNIHNDPLQREVLKVFQRIAEAIETPPHFWFRRKIKPGTKGLYLYGRVGAGKTFMMDLFYKNLTQRHKARVHFHQFMQQIDSQLRLMQGHSDPVKSIAEKISRTTRVLCIDEFLVKDIATAMVLAELLKHLYKKGIVLIITSNTPPDDLYLNGLQRIRFLPAIELLKQNCEIVDLTEPRDYRLGRHALLNAYLHPINEETCLRMKRQFDFVLNKRKSNSGDLSIQGRQIPAVQWIDEVVWFKFDVICNLPRSQLDYLEIASRFKTIFLSDVPRLNKNDTIKALLFIHFTDVLYDRRIKLIISAEVPIDELYSEGEMYSAFQRTRSRLQEMQSENYLP